MRENYALPRLYIDAALAQGAVIELSQAQSHYLFAVLRKRLGDSVRVFNGPGGEWRAQISTSEKRHVALRLIEQIRAPKACPDIMLCFALVKKQRNSFIAEKATELGASVLQPVITARTQFPKLNLDKMRTQIIEAAEQTERLDIPELKARISLADMLGEWDSPRHLIFADEAGDCPPAMAAIAALTGPAAILIGPEGGFTEAEREMLRAHKFVVPVSLGPRILRADTAALSLLTLWQATHGDWG
jgi:16S rRNA (uracil1498-N3)-methyltransferase